MAEKEIKIWQAFTFLEKKKQGPALLISLSGQAREAALELTVDKVQMME